MGTAQQCAAHHRAQVVGILDAVAQHQEGHFALGLGRRHQVIHRYIFDLAGKGSHALVALGAGHQAQLVGVHPLHGSTGLLGQRGVISRHGRGHTLRDEHRVHAGAALEQLGHRVLAVDEALAFLLRFLRAAARAARLILFFHAVVLLPLYAGVCSTPKAQDRSGPCAGFRLFMMIQNKV